MSCGMKTGGLDAPSTRPDHVLDWFTWSLMLRTWTTSRVRLARKADVVGLEPGRRRGREPDALERRFDARPRVPHRHDMPKVAHGLPRVLEDPLDARRLDGEPCADAAGRSPDVVEERRRRARERVSRALAEGEVETGRDEVDDNDGTELEVRGGPQSARDGVRASGGHFSRRTTT